MKAAKARVVGMVGRNDPITSVHAAEAVSHRKWTIRERVEAYARRVPHGFIDEDLRLLDPDAPESSFRKRRTELTDENVIIAGTETRKNRKGQDCVVWRHRDHVLNPPPIRAQQRKPSKLALLQEEVARLESETVRQYELGKFHERAAVVAWLRKDRDPGLNPFANFYAAAIDTGAHRA